MKGSDLARTFKRYELKYLVPLRKAEQIKHVLRAYLAADTNGGISGSYQLGNLYYDSPELLCYREKQNGQQIRRKLRIRYYQANTVFTEEQPVFVEIKERIDRLTRKQRVLLPYYQALQLCNDRQMPDSAEDQSTLEKMFGFIWQYNLRPSAIVRYRRTAFSGQRFDLGLRVTFDTHLTTQAGSLNLHTESKQVAFLPPTLSVMEIKVNERMPIWLAQLVARFNLQTTSFSKYCRSIETCRAIPRSARSYLSAESANDVMQGVATTYHQPTQAIAAR